MMTQIKKTGLTWISFLSYALTGALVIVTGMVMDNIAEYFHVPVASMSNTFTFLNTGILIAIFLNAWLMELVPLKRQLIFGFILMLIAIAGLVLGKSLTIFSASMFILGVVSGITMSIGTFLITHLYEGRQRGARLLFTDSFFSMAGTIFPIIAAAVLSRHLPWYLVYCAIGVIYLAIFILTLFTQFPTLNKPEKQKQVTKEKWGAGVFLLALAALCYILGQLGFIAWVPDYATKTLGLELSHAGQLVGNFWTAYMVGMWVFSFVLRIIDSYKLLVLLTALASILMYWFNHATDKNQLHLIITALGFFSSAIYTTIITLGSQQTKVASPKLVNFILTCGTIGTMLTFVVTSPIVNQHGPHAALLTANILYIAVFVCCCLLGFVTKHRLNHLKNH